MRFFVRSLLIFSLTLTSVLPAFADESSTCSKFLKAPVESLTERQASELSEEIAVLPATIESKLVKEGFTRREARGYAILIATMIGSAAATTAVSASLPENFQFVSHFLGQISTLGVLVFGAPIWEPLASGFRKMAFGVRGGDQHALSAADQAFEGQWRRTQENFSLNSQMSRNVTAQFLMLVQQNFVDAQRAMKSNDEDLAADQIALAALRLRTLFRDIDPTETAIIATVRAGFTNHLRSPSQFAPAVLKRLEFIDPEFKVPSVKKEYDRILKAWLAAEN